MSEENNPLTCKKVVLEFNNNPSGILSESISFIFRIIYSMFYKSKMLLQMLNGFIMTLKLDFFVFLLFCYW